MSKNFNKSEKNSKPNQKGGFNKNNKGGFQRKNNFKPNQADGIKFVRSQKIKKQVDDDTLQLRRLYNKLMLKKKDLNKPEIIKNILNIVKDKFVEYAFKHDGCRVLQGCIKYGSKEQRFQIIEQLSTSIYELVTKKYAIYLGMKMWKYAQKEQHSTMLPFILNKLKTLVKSASGKLFLNFVFTNSTNKIQETFVDKFLSKVLKIDIEAVKSFIDTNEDNDQNMEIDEEIEENEENEEDNNAEMEEEKNANGEEAAEENTTGNVIVSRSETYINKKYKEDLKKTFELALEKQYHKNILFQASLSFLMDYLPTKIKAYFSELFDDDFDSFFGSKSGVELFNKLYIVASAKTKKKIVKKIFQDNWTENILSNEVNLTLLTKLLLSTDDTKLTSKFILKPLLIYTNSHENGFQLFIKLVNGLITPEKINPMLVYNTDSTSKKDLDKIQVEIFASCFKDVKNVLEVKTDLFLIEQEPISFLKDLFDFLLKIEEKEKQESYIDDLLKTLFNYIEYDVLNNENDSIVSLGKEGHSTIVRITKKLLSQEPVLKCVLDFAEKLSLLIERELSVFIKSKGVFIVLIISENDKVGQRLRLKLKENKDLLKKQLKEDPKSKVIEILINKFCK